MAQAQSDREFLPRTSPYPVYRTPERAQYNLKWGNLTGRISSGMQIEFNDNINLSSTNPEADISVGPTLGIGFLWPISKANVLQLDFGVGYRWYLKHPSVSSISILPNSQISQTFFVDDVRINVHDSMVVVSEPTVFGPLGGGGANLIDFRRFVNTAGILADWQATKDTSFHAGYDHTLDRSLTSQFTFLDRDDHTFSAGVNHQFSFRLSGGLAAGYTIQDYRQQVQNDGGSFTIGPVMSYKVSPVLTVDGSAGFSWAHYDNSGSTGDTSQFTGATFQVGIRHTINKRTSHDLRVARHAGLGLNTNFTDTWSVQYGLRNQLTSAITLNTTAAYEYLEGSGVFGEQASRFLVSTGTHWRLTKNWDAAVSYTFSYKDSSMPNGGYIQNRLTLDISRRF